MVIWNGRGWRRWRVSARFSPDWRCCEPTDATTIVGGGGRGDRGGNLAFEVAEVAVSTRGRALEFLEGKELQGGGVVD